MKIDLSDAEVTTICELLHSEVRKIKEHDDEDRGEADLLKRLISLSENPGTMPQKGFTGYVVKFGGNFFFEGRDTWMPTPVGATCEAKEYVESMLESYLKNPNSDLKG